MSAGTAGTDCPAPGGTRCLDCSAASCALRHLAGGGAPAASAPRPPRTRRPWLRQRAASAAVLLVALALALGVRGLGLSGWAGLIGTSALGLWWSAPRATAPGLFELAALAALAAAGAASPARAADWPSCALALGLAASRLRPGRALAALGLAGLGLLAGARPAADPAGWSGLAAAAAFGLLLHHRRVRAAPAAWRAADGL